MTDTSDEPAIRTIELRKAYTSPRGDIPAVQGVDLTVPRGEFFGLLGPNGAGKSTTIGMLTTLVAPTSGRAEVSGIDVKADPVEVKRRIGVSAQNNTLDGDLNVAENVEFRGRYFGMSGRDARRRTSELLETFNLSSRRKATPFELSGGQAKRLMICRALVHRPEVLFLDEPTAGLDPQTRVNLWEILRALHGDGQTILLTTHYMEEAEALCQRVAVIDHGKVLACDSVGGLKASVGAEAVITVTYAEKPPGCAAELEQREEVSRVEITDRQVRVFAREANGFLVDLVSMGAKAGIAVTDATQQLPSLETVFLMLTGREYRE